MTVRALYGSDEWEVASARRCQQNLTAPKVYGAGNVPSVSSEEGNYRGMVGIAVTRNFVPQRHLPAWSTHEVCPLCQHPAKRNLVIRKSASAPGEPGMSRLPESGANCGGPYCRMEKTLEVWDRREVSANDAQVHQVYLEQSDLEGV